MMEKLAKALSYVFHPLLVPTIGFLLLLNSGFYFTMISNDAKRFIILIVFLSTFVLPLICISLILVMSRFKLDLDKSTDRIFPMLTTAGSYYMGYHFLGKLPLFPIYRLILLSAILTLAILLFVSAKWKISAHLAAVGGLVGAFLAISIRMHTNSSFLLGSLILIAGLVGTARIILGKHTPLQVYAGFLAGFSVNYLIIQLL